MVANSLPADTPPPDPGVGSKGQNSFFSEHGHVTCHIKWNHDCSNMQAHNLSLHTPSICGLDLKIKQYSECGHVVHQIKGKGV